MIRIRHFLGPSGERGSITPIVALGLMAFVGFLALGIDAGQLCVARNDLQNAADAAALAAAKKLIQDKNGDGVAEVYCGDAVNAAINCAKTNDSLGISGGLTVSEPDVVIGKWNLTTKQFDSVGCSENPMEVNAVQVTVRRDGMRTDTEGEETNPRLQTFLASVIGGGDSKEVVASATAYLGLAGTSAPDVPFAIPPEYTNGGGMASNGWQGLLDRFAPTPAYAAVKTYKWYDKADGSASSYPDLATNRATWVVANESEATMVGAYYAMQKYLQGTTRFPQKQVGEKLYPGSEHIYGMYLKDYFEWMRSRWNTKKDASGKWRVTVAVYSPTQVTAYRPQNSWLKLAARLIPGVSQAHACTVIKTPVVYTQGFATIDITNVYVQYRCNEANNGTIQRDDPNSCRNTCYMEIEVPMDQNTVSTDKGSNPVPYQKDYKDMNPSAQEVGVFASVPRIVK